ncbi:HAMP domain-containing histidine kinase [Ktedonosporobacter rubrisoli]|uniref:histidine kinase n=1 Tax=Ktedonosporobacter rubrisoli TaxID=2509675 RepID=A0A4P6JIN3_KTERU|nr:HAMP domain-containing sensor histidine kinase [Ktedonosporobacter rubrisoli]QBD74928.1 HAMP domain-containing histidine kinase [Ktedonosporobacter rubrisoli]
MGNRSISLKENRQGRRRTSFRRVFVWYCIGIVGTTFVITCFIEFLLIFWYMEAKHAAPIMPGLPMDVLVLRLALTLPFVILILAILYFAWRMGRRVSQPVNELMQAVEKIREQDLDFTITYNESNELGDLCYAFNELRSELQESLKREWRKQEELRTMVAALSHDLRTPVTIIQGHVEGLGRAEAGEKRNQRLERSLPVLEASSQRMMRLLNDMLLVCALEQTDFLIRPQAIKLEEELARKGQVYTLQAASSGIAFEYRLHQPSADPPPVLLDLHRVEQVLDNLFENALRYTPANGQICLTCTCDAQALVFTLHDSGSGIAAEDLPHVWEKFYRGQPPAGKRSSKTTGLGLYTCKLLVERLGGTITLRNHPSGGCEVSFRLPIVEAKAY